MLDGDCYTFPSILHIQLIHFLKTESDDCYLLSKLPLSQILSVFVDAGGRSGTWSSGSSSSGYADRGAGGGRGT